jgi:hypothetical protein
MPCFKGLAVSIHTPNGPISEYSVQRTSRLGRISTYIPVPPATIPTDSTSGKPEQSTFAISITLLTPNQEVPYSTPKATKDNPDPKPKLVGDLPGHTDGKPLRIGPYVPLTTSPNETIAAYIYFDGRAKEEVATLLRKGEETWVNSRWVSVPEKEGGGLAEREFLFREVGLERWLNGLDLDGKDAAATIERRRQKLERRRRKKKDTAGSDDETNGLGRNNKEKRKSTLRYGEDGELKAISDDEESMDETGSSEEDDDPIPESAGQIKVALFRVLASGEIKRGEYSPQFDAHDDSEGSDAGEGNANSKGDVDHTTSFAKPKTLDPKTISTQTVTGIDPTDKPYAVFTFLYRGERQLQKMGILPGAKAEKTVAATKRRSIAAELPKLGPLKKAGTSGFSGFRDAEGRRRSKGKRASEDDMESDSDDEGGADIIGKMEDINDADLKKDSGMLSPEDAERTGQVAEGIRKMKVRGPSPLRFRHGLRYYQLKRQHSAEPLNSNGASDARKSSKSGSPSNASTPQIGAEDLGTSPGGLAMGGGALSTSLDTTKAEENFMVGSPMKRQRASMADFDDQIKNRLGGGLISTSGTIGEVLQSSGTSTANPSGLHFGGALVKEPASADDDEEL